MANYLPFLGLTGMTIQSTFNFDLPSIKLFKNQVTKVLGNLFLKDYIAKMYHSCLCFRVQDIFRDSLRSPELRLRVVKYKPGVKKPPPPVYPKPPPLHDRDAMAMVEGEERSEYQ